MKKALCVDVKKIIGRKKNPKYLHLCHLRKFLLTIAFVLCDFILYRKNIQRQKIYRISLRNIYIFEQGVDKSLVFAIEIRWFQTHPYIPFTPQDTTSTQRFSHFPNFRFASWGFTGHSGTDFNYEIVKLDVISSQYSSVVSHEIFVKQSIT